MNKSQNLEQLRKRIDTIDKKIIKLIQERLKMSSAIAIYKQKYQLPIIQKKREQDAIQKRTLQARAMDIDTTFIERLFKLIIKHSRAIQAKTQKKTPIFDKKGKNW